MDSILHAPFVTPYAIDVLGDGFMGICTALAISIKTCCASCEEIFHHTPTTTLTLSVGSTETFLAFGSQQPQQAISFVTSPRHQSTLLSPGTCLNPTFYTPQTPLHKLLKDLKSVRLSAPPTIQLCPLFLELTVGRSALLRSATDQSSSGAYQQQLSNSRPLYAFLRAVGSPSNHKTRNSR